MKNTIASIIALLALVLLGCQSTTLSHEQANEEIDKTEQALVGGLQINEVAASGAKFVEIFNAGSTSVNLANYKVAYGDSSAGPNVGAACTLSGSLAAGAYLQVRTSCTGLPNCAQCALVYSSPDINPVTGVDGPITRNFYLLNAANNSVFETVVYPNSDGTPTQSCTCRYDFFGNWMCSNTVPLVGMSWGAMPNGGDCFRVTSPTPITANSY